MVGVDGGVGFWILGGEGLVEEVEGLVEGGFEDGEGGAESEDVFLGGVDDESECEGIFYDGGGVGDGEFDAEHETLAADVFDESGGVFEVADSVDGDLAEACGGGGELVFVEGFKDSGGDGGADRVSAQGAAVGAGLQVCGQFGSGEHAADGDSAADGFTEGKDIGCDASVLMGEVFAGASAAGPDFVEDEGEVMAVAEVADSGEVIVSGDIHSAFALDGFNDDGAGFGIDGLFEGGEVVEGDMDEAGDEGVEAFLVIGSWGCGECAMVRPWKPLSMEMIL